LSFDRAFQSHRGTLAGAGTRLLEDWRGFHFAKD
jgi:hypothetical protein